MTCHGAHAILPPKDPKSPVAEMNVPLLCGRLPPGGDARSRAPRHPAGGILENYAESIHGEGLFKKGLTVTAVCTSCHTAHFILPHTDPRSTISARQHRRRPAGSATPRSSRCTAR